MRGIYKWAWHTGRGGSLMGIFSAESEEVEKAIGREVSFGEVLGKHSDVYGTLEKDEFEFVTDDAAFVEQFDKLGCSTGYNPITRLIDQDADREEGS